MFYFPEARNALTENFFVVCFTVNGILDLGSYTVPVSEKESSSASS